MRWTGGQISSVQQLMALPARTTDCRPMAASSSREQDPTTVREPPPPSITLSIRKLLGNLRKKLQADPSSTPSAPAASRETDAALDEFVWIDEE
jgi:hypothetical protein